MKNLYAEIKAMFPLIPRRLGWRSPEYALLKKRDYRRKKGIWVAGYTHGRMYSSSMSGLVTDRILGWGDTPEAAVRSGRAC